MATFDIQDGVLVKIKKPDKVIIVPEGITTIGENVFGFSDCPWDSHSGAVLEIRISKGVRKICDKAFFCCRNLHEIFLPNTVTEIGSEIFLGCEWIEKIEVEEGNPAYYSENNCLIDRSTKTLIAGCKNSAIPNGVTIIGHAAFRNCEISHLVLPESIKEIRDEAFLGSTLHNITIPKGGTTIGNRAFQDCHYLEYISFPSTVVSIGSDAFRYCTNLTSIRVADNNPIYRSSDNCLIERETNTLIYGFGKCVIPSDIIKIERFAFEGNKELREIKIPDGVTEIGEGAFRDCENLREVFIPSSVKVIAGGAFAGCKGRFVIEEGVTKIGGGAFSGCSLEDFKIPTTVTEIGEHAFHHCSHLKDIALPRGLKIIANATFAECPTLESVIISEGVTKIDERAFTDCKSLKAIAIPSTVTEIAEDALGGCSSLEKIEVADGNPAYEAKNGCLIAKETGTLLAAYKTAVIPSGIKTIAKEAFHDNEELTEISIPSGVAEIGNRAFQSCGNLKEVTFPDNIKMIGVQAFENCTNLEKITFSENIIALRLGSCAFQNCGFRELTIPGCIKEINEDAFANCYKLERVVISEGVTKIKQRAFAGGKHLESITLPNTLKVLGNIVFRECCLLKELTIPNSVTKIGKNLLRLTNLQTLTLPRRFESVISTLGVDMNKTKIIYTED